MSDITLVLTPEAQRNIQNMRERVAEIGECCGFWSDDYVDALKSLMDCLITVIGLGGHVYAEDDLSLIVNSFITVGIIAHRKVRAGERDSVVVQWSAHS